MVMAQCVSNWSLAHGQSDDDGPPQVGCQGAGHFQAPAPPTALALIQPPPPHTHTPPTHTLRPLLPRHSQVAPLVKVLAPVEVRARLGLLIGGEDGVALAAIGTLGGLVAAVHLAVLDGAAVGEGDGPERAESRAWVGKWIDRAAMLCCRLNARAMSGCCSPQAAACGFEMTIPLT